MDYLKDFDDGYFTTSLGKLHLKHHKGSGKKILLLHGLGATTRSWHRLIEYLPEYFDVYIVDLLGHGDSDKPEIDYTIDAQVSTVKQIVESIGACCIVGHSYGGWIAAYYAANNQDCKALVLIDCAGIQELFDQRVKQDEDAAIKEMLKSLLINNKNDSRVMDSILANRGLNLLDKTTLNRINVPTIIIWGSNDDLIDEHYGSIISEHINGSTLYIIENAAHNPHYTDPTQVSSIIINFVTKVTTL